MRRIITLIIGLMILVSTTAQAGFHMADKETKMFLDAKAHVFDRYWKEAGDRLEGYLDRYPEGRYVAEARYWLARSLNQLSREEKRANMVIQLKERAIENLDALLERHPESVWKDDARTLRVEVSAELALLGLAEYQQYIQAIVEEQNKDESELMIIALEALIQLEPAAVLPMIEGVLAAQDDPKIRKMAVTLLGSNHRDEALPILRNVESNDADEAVRKEAAYWRKQIQMMAIQVQVDYFCYNARIEKEGDRARIPEGKLNVYDFPALDSPGKRRVEKAVKKLFDGKLDDVKFAANATVGTFLPRELASLGMTMSTAHNLSGFRVEVPRESIEKSHFKVSGDVSFYDKVKDREYLEKFTVDRDDAKLMAMRRGDEVAILVLIFVSTSEPPDVPDEPVYYTEINNVFGAVVHSSRQSWSMDELKMDSAVVEYGRAKAEIPGETGIWTLVGDLQLHREARRFIGRDAILYNPKGDVVAEALEIIVPADKPADYEIGAR
jgi:hypothetical protein